MTSIGPVPAEAAPVVVVVVVALLVLRELERVESRWTIEGRIPPCLFYLNSNFNSNRGQRRSWIRMRRRR
jgi:hypothetical protein